MSCGGKETSWEFSLLSSETEGAKDSSGTEETSSDISSETVSEMLSKETSSVLSLLVSKEISLISEASEYSAIVSSEIPSEKTRYFPGFRVFPAFQQLL